MNSATIVQKLCNYCNGLRPGRSLAGSPTRKRAGAFGKPRFTLGDDDWPLLLVRDGDELFDHYRHALEALGNEKGTLAIILSKSGAARWPSSRQRYRCWPRLAGSAA